MNTVVALNHKDCTFTAVALILCHVDDIASLESVLQHYRTSPCSGLRSSFTA
jgi:hypothetical protein